MKKLLLIQLVIFISSVFFAACSFDKENHITSISDIEISNLATSGSASLGSTLDLNPTVKVDGKDADCSFMWFMYKTESDGTVVLDTLSTEQHFQFLVFGLPSGTTSFTLRLEVTDNATGIQTSTLLTYSLSARLKRGWIFLKENEDGDTDADAFIVNGVTKDKIENLISFSSGKALKGSPVGIQYEEYYRWMNPETNSFEDYIKALFFVSNKDICAYRLIDEKTLSNYDNLFYESKDESQRDFKNAVTLSSYFALNDGGKMFLRNIRAPRFMPSIEGNYDLSNLIGSSHGYSSNILVFNKTNSSFGYIAQKATEIEYFPDTYLPEKGGLPGLAVSVNNMNSELLQLWPNDAELDTIEVSTWSKYGSTWALMKENGNTTQYKLYGLNMYNLDPYNPDLHSPIRKEYTINLADCPDFADADFYTMHESKLFIYFVKNNKISSYDIVNNVFTTNIYEIPAGEDVTYFRFIDCQFDSGSSYDPDLGGWVTTDFNFTHLMIATSKADNYKIYQLDERANSLTLNSESFEGKGKVKYMLWLTPAYQLSQSMYIFQ